MCGPGPLLGPMLAVWGRSWDLCWRSRASTGGPGPSVGGLGLTWAALGAYVGGLGPLLGPMLAILGHSWSLCGRSGAEKCEEHGYLENLFISSAGARSAASWAVLGHSWDLCRAYVRDLGASFGGLRPLSGLMLVVLAALGAYVSGPWRP